MSTPTDEQQLRATLRRYARKSGDGAAARLGVRCIIDILGFPLFEAAALDRMPALDRATFTPDALPPLMGASEAADVLGMKATNLKRLSPPLPVAAVISGRIPVYREVDVLAAKARRDERRRAA